MKYPMAVAAFFAASAVHAQTYVVGVEEAAFLPHYNVDAQGQYGGYARELLDRFAKDAGLELTYRPMPAEELLPALLAGRIDFKYPDSPDWSVGAKLERDVHYSQPVARYIDGVLVPPRRVGLGLEQLKRLAVVDGWTPRGYEAALASGQTLLVPGEDLRQMIRQALLKDTDGAFYNVVVATHYLGNIRARPGALVFDPALPHTRGAYHLSSVRHPEVIERFDRFLSERADVVTALKAEHGVEAHLDSEYLGLEQWKIEHLERRKARDAAAAQ